jgi:hypothetical protein
MRRLALTLALLPALCGAQAIDAVPTCLPNSSAQAGGVWPQAWATWQCRPADRTKRAWDRFYVVIDATALPAGAGAVYDAYKRGDKSALAMGAALRTKPLTDPAFADSFKAAKAEAATQAPIPVNATADDQACACDIKAIKADYWWQCPLASKPTGALVQCKPL